VSCSEDNVGMIVYRENNGFGELCGCTDKGYWITLRDDSSDATTQLCNDGNTQTVACTGLPSNAEWIGGGTVNQKRIANISNGFMGFSPSSVGVSESDKKPEDQCVFKCKEGYVRNGSSCVVNTRTQNCTPLPANATWNTVSSITQTTTDGSNWTPSLTTVYNPTASSTECRFRCADNNVWNGSSCVANTRTQNCTPLPVNATWNTVSSITQTTTDGSNWAPSLTTVHNATASTTACRFRCNPNYSWIASSNSCVANTQPATCASAPLNATLYTASTFTQTRNGSNWAPSNAVSHESVTGSTHCKFRCNNGFTRNGSSCVANTVTATCQGLPVNAVWSSNNSTFKTITQTNGSPSNRGSHNSSTAANECFFKCNSGHTWNGSNCAANLVCGLGQANVGGVCRTVCGNLHNAVMARASFESLANSSSSESRFCAV
jgi:hypothetical protein